MQAGHSFRVTAAAVVLAVGTATGVLHGEAASNPAFAQDVGIPSEDIDRYVSDLMAEERIPGAAVVVVRRDRVEYVRGFGAASLRNPSPVTSQTVFDLASCSKSFTALAVLMLYHRGLIDLDNPATEYLPDFRLADDDASSRITVRHLLNHTSGLPGRFAEPLAFHSGPDAMDKLVSCMDRILLNQPAGTSFEYSDLNYALLGAIVERVTGTAFEEYLQENVLEPLGLESTTLYPEEAALMHRADGHQISFGQVVARNTPSYRSAAPAGWVMSSAGDMGRWLILHLNEGRLDGRQMVPAPLIELMHTAEVTFTQDGRKIGYGMGWFTGVSADHQPMLWHGGDTANFASDMVLLPGLDLGVAVLVNSQNSSRVHDIAPGVVSLILGQPFELPAAPWLASWQAADIMATGATALSVILLLVLPAYAWRQWRSRKLQEGRHTPPGHTRTLRVWRQVLPLTPLALLTATLAAATSVAWVLLGVNVFGTLTRFGAFAPPGVWASGWLLFATISSWALVLAARTVVSARRTRTARRTGDKG